MKLKYLLAPLAVATAFLFTACDDNDYDPDVLSNLKVSNSYIFFSGDEAETQTITLTATEDWYFITEESTITAKDTVLNETTIFGVDAIPDWLSISPLSGSAGEYTVTLSAPATDSIESVLLGIRVGNTTQYINVSIGSVKEYTYNKVTTITSGGTYLIVAPNNSVAMNAISESSSYAYPASSAVTISGDSIVASNMELREFVISTSTYDSSNYTIMDYYGRYCYQSGGYNSLNVTTTAFASCDWTFTVQDDGTFEIVSTNNYILQQGSGSYTTFAAYASAQSTDNTLALFLRQE